MAVTDVTQQRDTDLRLADSSGLGEQASRQLEFARKELADGKYEKAIESAESALRLNPLLYEALLIKALAFEGFGDFEKAESLLVAYQEIAKGGSVDPRADEALERIRSLKNPKEKKQTQKIPTRAPFQMGVQADYGITGLSLDPLNHITQGALTINIPLIFGPTDSRGRLLIRPAVQLRHSFRDLTLRHIYPPNNETHEVSTRYRSLGGFMDVGARLAVSKRGTHNFYISPFARLMQYSPYFEDAYTTWGTNFDFAEVQSEFNPIGGGVDLTYQVQTPALDFSLHATPLLQLADTRVLVPGMESPQNRWQPRYGLFGGLTVLFGGKGRTEQTIEESPIEEKPIIIEGDTISDKEEPPIEEKPVIIEGDVTIQTEEDIERIAKIKGPITIAGNLRIQMTELRDLSRLDNILYVEGNLVIYENRSLELIGGLNNLRRVGGSLVIANNYVLEHLDGFGALESVGGDLWISSNELLEDVFGFENLRKIGGDLDISDNKNLVLMPGLKALEEVGGRFEISENKKLKGIATFESLETIGGEVRIENNPRLAREGVEDFLSRFQQEP